MRQTCIGIAAGFLAAALAASSGALAQQHPGRGGADRSPGGHAGDRSPGWRGDRSPGWRGGNGTYAPHRGFQGQHPFAQRPFAHRPYGYYPRYGRSYPYYVPPVIGYYGPSYYDWYPVTPYYAYDYVEPPAVYYEPPAVYYDLPPVAQAAPPPPPRPTAPAAPPEPPPPQPMPAPKTFERYTLSASELFAFDRAELTLPQPKLDQIAAALNANPQIGNVRILGYTDRLGSAAYNLKLSQRRADAVKSYFVSKGVAAERLVAVGRGEADPIVFCEQKNRAELIACLRANRRVVVEPITVEQRR